MVAASVHHVVRVAFTVLVQPAVAQVPGRHGLHMFRVVHMIVTMEVQVVVRPKDG